MICIVTACPCRPRPMVASVMRSLGGTKGAPSTWRGTIMKVAAAPANARRESRPLSELSMATSPTWRTPREHYSPGPAIAPGDRICLMPEVTGVVETCLYVDDLERAERFYADICDFKKLIGDERFCAFSVADQDVLLLF